MCCAEHHVITGRLLCIWSCLQPSSKLTSDFPFAIVHSAASTIVLLLLLALKRESAFMLVMVTAEICERRSTGLQIRNAEIANLVCAGPVCQICWHHFRSHKWLVQHC